MTNIAATWRELRLTIAVLGRTLAGQILLWIGGRLQARGVYLVDRGQAIARANRAGLGASIE